MCGGRKMCEIITQEWKGGGSILCRGYTAALTPIQIFQLASAGAPGKIGTRCRIKERFRGSRNQKDRTAGGLEHKQSVKFVPKIKMRQKDAARTVSAFDFRLLCEVEVEISAPCGFTPHGENFRADFVDGGISLRREVDFSHAVANIWPTHGRMPSRNVSVSRAWAAYPWDTRAFSCSDTVCVYLRLLVTAADTPYPSCILCPLRESSCHPLCKQIKCSACLLFCLAPNDEDQQGHTAKKQFAKFHKQW